MTLTATGTDAYGTPLSTNAVAWSVANPERAGISLGGILTAFEPGPIEVIAAVQNNTARFAVSVTPATGVFVDRLAFGGTDNEGGENIVRDAQGNVYVAGSTAGTLNDQEAQGTSDAFVVRFLPNGRRAWTKMVQTYAIDGANGLALHPSGGVVVSASHPYGSSVYYINAAGQTVWERSLQGAGVNDLTTDAAGNVYVAATAQRQFNGGLNSIVGPPRGTITQGGASDGALIKLDPSGQPVWGKLFAHVPADQTGTIPVFSTDPTGVVVDETHGAIYVCGAIQANAFFGLVGWVRRFDLNGAEQWNRFTNADGLGVEPAVAGDSFSRPLGNLVFGIALGNTGEVYLGGGTGQQDWDTRSFIVRVSPDGRQEWRRELDIEASAASAIVFRPAQNDVVALATVGTHLLHDPFQSGTLVNLSASGVEGWRKTLLPRVAVTSSQTGVSPRSLVPDSAGNLFVVGDTFTDFADLINASGSDATGGSDLFVARVPANGG